MAIESGNSQRGITSHLNFYHKQSKTLQFIFWHHFSKVGAVCRGLGSTNRQKYVLLRSDFDHKKSAVNAMKPPRTREKGLNSLKHSEVFLHFSTTSNHRYTKPDMSGTLTLPPVHKFTDQSLVHTIMDDSRVEDLSNTLYTTNNTTLYTLDNWQHLISQKSQPIEKHVGQMHFI